MALRAGYHGVKRNVLDELEKLDGILPAGVSKDNKLSTQSEINDIWKDNVLTGVHQLMPYDLDTLKLLNTNGSWVDNVYTYGNHTFTVNSDNSITVEGTGATSFAVAFYLWRPQTINDVKNVVGKNIIMSGVTGGSATTYMLSAYRVVSVDGSSGSVYQHSTPDKAFEWKNNCSGTKPFVAFNIESGVTITSTIVKPLLRYAADVSDEFSSYAKTNLELTASAADQKTAINAIIAAATGAADFAAFKAAMGAITPVTRSLAAPAELTIEEPVTEKKTTRKRAKITTSRKRRLHHSRMGRNRNKGIIRRNT